MRPQSESTKSPTIKVPNDDQAANTSLDTAPGERRRPRDGRASGPTLVSSWGDDARKRRVLGQDSAQHTRAQWLSRAVRPTLLVLTLVALLAGESFDQLWSGHPAEQEHSRRMPEGRFDGVLLDRTACTRRETGRRDDFRNEGSLGGVGSRSRGVEGPGRWMTTNPPLHD